MLKKLSGVMAVGLLAPSAFAQQAAQGPKVGLDLRFDGVQSQTEVKPAGGKSEKSMDSKFVTKRVRFKLTGDLTAKTSYALTISPKDSWNNGNAAYGVDGSPQALILASVTHKFSDMVAVTIGKLGVNVFSVENNVWSGYDMFFYSNLNNRFYDAYANDGSEVGAQLDLAFGDHNIALQVVNGLKGKRDNNESKGSLTTSLMYSGKLAGGLVEPNVSISNWKHADRRMGNQVSTTVGDKTTTSDAGWGKTDSILAYGVGATINVAGARIDLEQQGYDVKESKDEAKAVVVPHENAQGQVVYVGYKVSDMLTPWLRLTNDVIKQDAWAGTTKVEQKWEGTSWGLGTWIFPEENSPMRFHAAYYQEKVVAKVAGKRVETSTKGTINLGAGVKF